MSDHSELKRLAEAFPDYEWDSNQTPFFNGPSGESLGGEPTGFYCVYGQPFEIDGETYDGVTLIESCPVDQAKFICEAKGAVLALIAEVENLDHQSASLIKTARQANQLSSDILDERNQAREEVKRLAIREDVLENLCDARFRINLDLETDRDQLKAEVEALRLDAGRYRWTTVEGNWVARIFGKWRAHTGEYGDSNPTDWFDTREEAIDAAMSAEAKP